MFDLLNGNVFVTVRRHVRYDKHRKRGDIVKTWPTLEAAKQHAKELNANPELKDFNHWGMARAEY
jgi:hypothetical protein